MKIKVEESKSEPDKMSKTVKDPMLVSSKMDVQELYDEWGGEEVDGVSEDEAEELLDEAGFSDGDVAVDEDILDDASALEDGGTGGDEEETEVLDEELGVVSEDGETGASLLYPEEEDELKGKKRRQKGKKAKKEKKKWSVGRKIIVIILVLLLLVGIVLGGYIMFLLGKTTEVFEGNPIEAIFGTDLKESTSGRSNFLIFGTSEDDEGHSGAMLADSILVFSLDQEKKDAKVFSVPRDLWVDYGMACSAGYQGKINATYMCALAANNNDRKAAGEYFAKKVGEIFGIEMQYYVGVDFTVVREVTDTLGGIDVEIYSDDSRGIYDPNMHLNLPAGVNHLNGDEALRLTRARNAKGGYGLSRSNFDREINQQRVIQAMFNKASPGILANPGQAISLLESLGDNIKTNVTIGEARRVLEVMSELNGGIESLDTTKLFSTGGINGASVVIPAGVSVANPLYFDGLKAWAEGKF